MLIIFLVYSVNVTLARVKIVFNRCFIDCRIFCPTSGDIVSWISDASCVYGLIHRIHTREFIEYHDVLMYSVIIPSQCVVWCNAMCILATKGDDIIGYLG